MTDIFSCETAHAIMTSPNELSAGAPMYKYLSSISGNIILSSKAHTNAMMMRKTHIFQKEEPVILLTAHSIGKAWQRAIINDMIVASRIESGMDIIAAMPA